MPLAPRSLALATDLYELTMAAAYYTENIRMTATFELFVRDLPTSRRFLLVAGLDQVLAYLENLCFTDEDIAYLRRHPVFASVRDDFFDFLRSFRFTGDVWAIPEGLPAFANEPLVRVTAPILQAQIVETFLLATVNFQTMIASKAARVVWAAQGRPVIEFGSRRAHGTEAALYAARAAYIGGCAGTSNVEAGLRFGIPTFGTIAHSWVMSFEDELTAFRSFMEVFPTTTTLLIDTYDTVEAAHKIVEAGLKPQAVRLDSGELVELSREVRDILDRGGLNQTRIFASGDLDEYRIGDLLARGACVDAFGVGTRLSTSSDEPHLGGVYKLVEIVTDHEVKGRLKTSPGKATFPGRKQVYRFSDAQGLYTHDLLALADEPAPAGGEAILQPVMMGGQRLRPAPTLEQVRQRAQEALMHLPKELRDLEPGPSLPVRVGERLQAEQRKIAAARSGR